MKDFDTFMSNREYFMYNKTITEVLTDHIPIVELRLIIHDYAAIPDPNKNIWGQCPNCYKNHKRKLSNLCMNCSWICLFPGCGGKSISATSAFCLKCVLANSGLAESVKHNRKDCLFFNWFCIDFPSQKYREALEGKKLVDAAFAAEQKKLDDFFAAEDSKPKDQQIAELRAKLYDAYDQIRMNTHHLSNGKMIPRRPFF